MSAMKPTSPLPVAVLISGGGTTLRNLLQHVRAGTLDINIRLVLSSSAQAGGLAFANEAAVPTLVLPAKQFPTPADYGDAVFGACREASVELVVMGGFLKHLLVPPDFENRVVNIHPALIPAFCGKGFYGQHVHQSVLDYGCKVSGCTVHFADNQYDHGPIILQRTVLVLDDDTAETLAKRVFEQECEAYPEAIRWIAAGQVRVVGRRVIRESPT
jgi:phosphoribosylglycinamide formyltransferase-1